MEIQEALAVAATQLAHRINADAILTLTETGGTYELVLRNNFSKSIIKRATGIHHSGLKLVAATPNHETYEKLKRNPHTKVVRLATRDPSRIGQIRHAVWRSLRDGILWPGELVVCLVGDAGSPGGTDTIFIYRIKEQELKIAEIVETDPVVAAVIDIATELGCGGWHGHPVGTSFVVGDSKAVLRRSRQLIPNPFKGHPPIFLTNERDREIIKRFAYLDGAFIVGEDGRVITAGRYLDANAQVDIPLGLGTRHRSVATMTAATKAVGITVSGEDGIIRIFRAGEAIAKIDPKGKMLMETLME